MTLLGQLTQRDIVFPSRSGLGCCWAPCTARAGDGGFCHPRRLWSGSGGSRMAGKTPEIGIWSLGVVLEEGRWAGSGFWVGGLCLGAAGVEPRWQCPSNPSVYSLFPFSSVLLFWEIREEEHPEGENFPERVPGCSARGEPGCDTCDTACPHGRTCPHSRTCPQGRTPQG